MRTLLVACASAAALTFSGDALAQATAPAAPPSSQPQPQSEPQPQIQGPTFRTGVEVIAVDVAVVNDRGKPVEDLLAPDFVVKIDGVPRRVVSAEQVKIDVEAAKREYADRVETLYTTNLTPPNGRMIVIAVDQLNIRPGAVRPLLATAVKFLESLSPADRVAFVAYPEPGVFVDFTNDRLKLKQAMERVVGTQSTFSGKFNIGLYEAVAINDRHDDRIYQIVIQRECRRLVGFALEQCERDVLVESEMMVANVRQDTNQSLRGLFQLLQYLSLIEGPKSLILMSEGMVLDSQSDLDLVIRAAAVGRVAVNVLLMDVPRGDVMLQQMPPTASEDRDMQMGGLENLASGARGALYNVIGTGENIFNRLSSELSAYYVLAVEQVAGDRDDRNHRIDVEVRRKDVTIRSRRAFVLSSAKKARKPEETLGDILRSPFGVAELPLRVATFSRHDAASGKVRVLIAADVGQPGVVNQDFSIGYVLVDRDGKVVAGNTEKRTLSAPDGQTTTAPAYLGELVVESGTYALRFAVVDSSGRRGGVVRDVNAWKFTGEEFALGDLLIGDFPTTGEPTVRPGVEPRVREQLAAYFELYSTAAATFENTKVNIEIADEQDGPALTTGPARMVAGADPTSRTAQAIVSAIVLPPGRYFARARIERDGKTAGVLLRPFILDAPAPNAPMPVFALAVMPQFNPSSVMSKDVLTAMLDTADKGAPALKDAMAAARGGRYAAAALEALTAGDQTLAAFFKGLDWYSKGQIGQAAIQLQLAAGPRREFFPAAFYLGAALAAGGKDRDAAGIWQLAIGNQPRPRLAYVLFADARLRDGQPTSVIDVLKPMYETTPADDEIAMRLASAMLMTGRYVEARPVLDTFLATHPTDQAALFAAVFAQYQATTREHLALSAADRTKLMRYVRAYQGPQQALLTKYLDVMAAR
jgi:VWFA-related protein